MGEYFKFFLIFLIILPFSTCNKLLKSQTKMFVASKTLTVRHFKPGVTADAMPDSFYYNKYIPLVFQLKVPDWSVESLKLNASIQCNSDASGGGGMNVLCPVAYHLDRILAPLADGMRFSKNIFTPTEGWSYFGKFSCDVIEPHFFHLSAHIDELHLYTDKLRSSCALAKSLMPIMKNITTTGPSHHVSMASARFFGSASSSPNIDVRPTFGWKTRLNNTSRLAQTQAQAQMAGYVGLQTAQILAKYMDTIRWNNAFSQCQNSRLSIGLINSFWLRTALQPIQKIAEENGYKLSIPLHEYLPHYYKLPLTDCILGIQTAKRTTLLLRTLVPVLKKEAKYTRFRLTKIPYLIVDGGQKKICEIDNFDPKDDFLVEEMRGVPGAKPMISLSPECYESELCHLPEQPRNLIVDPCLKGLINGSIDHVKEFCSFECFPIDNEEVMLPIIMKVAPNQYSITGSHKTKPLHVYCDGLKSHELEPNKTNGVLQVMLPCNCEIRFKSEIFKSSRPCDAPFEVHYLSSIPIQVLYAGNGKGEPETPETTKAEEELSEKLKASQESSPHHLLPSSVPADLVEDDKVTLLVPESHTGAFVLIWITLLLLTLSNLLLLYIIHANQLIDLRGFRDMIRRWGVTTTNPPRSRLNDDNPQDGNTLPRGRNTNGNTNGSNNNRETNLNQINASGTTNNDPWPVGLTREIPTT